MTLYLDLFARSGMLNTDVPEESSSGSDADQALLKILTLTTPCKLIASSRMLKVHGHLLCLKRACLK